jgi:hypothetical protein
MLRARSDRAARHGAERARLLGSMEAAARDRAAKLERDSAVHEALLRRQAGGGRRAGFWGRGRGADICCIESGASLRPTYAAACGP